MTFGLSGAALAGIAVGGATLISGLAQADAAESAAATQAGAAGAGIDEQRRQFDQILALLKPYVDVGAPAIAGLQAYTAAGAPAFEQQQALAGVLGPDRQRQAIAQIEQGAGFQASVRQGEEALLSRASATGGLRGGNIQAALAQFRPQMLQAEIDKQYGRLGGFSDIGRETLTNLAKFGQSSAAGVGAQAASTGANVARLLGQEGAALAGGEIAQGRAVSAIPGAIGAGLGLFQGLGGSFNTPYVFGAPGQGMFTGARSGDVGF